MEKQEKKAITRRSALKQMGLPLAGAFVMGLPSLASCDKEEKKRIILYYTETGNCLHIAKEHVLLWSIKQANRFFLPALCQFFPF